MTGPAWVVEGSCVGLDPELFFPINGSDSTIPVAKRVCADCVVRVECLTYALDNSLDHGIWGGLTELERRRIRNPDIPISEAAQIRAWAAEHGHSVPPRGRIPDTTRSAYEAGIEEPST